MADKYEVDLQLCFGGPADASNLRKAVEVMLAGGLTTVGDRYSVSVADETGTCEVQATLRFSDKKLRDKLATTAGVEQAKAKPGAVGHITTHTCRHDAGDHGFDSCADLVVKKWGDGS